LKNPISNDVFDSRDLIEYIDELKEEIVDIWNDTMKRNLIIERVLEEDDEVEPLDEVLTFEDIDLDDERFSIIASEEILYLEKILEFESELEMTDDYKYGISIIHKDYFTEYCTEFLEEVGYVPKDFPTWIVIDYEATALNMRSDYFSTEYEGETYYTR